MVHFQHPFDYFPGNKKYPLFSISPLRSLSPSQSVCQGWERGREGSAPRCGSPATTRRNISGKRWTLTAEFAQNDICGLKVFLLQSQANAIFVHSLWKQWISFVCARIFGWSARGINNQNHSPGTWGSWPGWSPPQGRPKACWLGHNTFTTEEKL